MSRVKCKATYLEQVAVWRENGESFRREYIRSSSAYVCSNLTAIVRPGHGFKERDKDASQDARPETLLSFRHMINPRCIISAFGISPPPLLHLVHPHRIGFRLNNPGPLQTGSIQAISIALALSKAICHKTTM